MSTNASYSFAIFPLSLNIKIDLSSVAHPGLPDNHRGLSELFIDICLSCRYTSVCGITYIYRRQK